MSDINTVLAERMAKVSGDIKDKVIDMMVAETVEKRSNQIVAALKEQEKLLKDIKRYSKPDNQTFNVDGTVANESFSKDAIERLNKAKQRSEKIEAAISEALNNGKFDLLDKLDDGKPEKSSSDG